MVNNSINLETGKKSIIQSMIDFITEYSFLTITMLFILMVFISILVSVFFDKIPYGRNNTGIFDTLYIFVFALLFIIIIFRFMGAETVLFGKKFDLGLGIYLGIIFFIAFVMGG